MKWLSLSCLGLIMVLVLTLGGAAQSEDELVGAKWLVVEIDGSPVAASPPKREAHMVFKAEGRVSGSSGCNRFSGGYAQEANGFRFTPLAVTKMACPPPLDIQEKSFLQAMKAIAAVRQSDKTLELLDAAGKVRLRLQAR